VALVAWHRLQTCARPSLAVAYAFVLAFGADVEHPQGYEGEAPEAGAAIG
jgi:hypothetical protein